MFLAYEVEHFVFRSSLVYLICGVSDYHCCIFSIYDGQYQEKLNPLVVYSNCKVTSLYYLTELQGQLVFYVLQYPTLDSMLLPLYQNTCDQRTGVAERERKRETNNKFLTAEKTECQQGSSYDSEQW